MEIWYKLDSTGTVTDNVNVQPADLTGWVSMTIPDPAPIPTTPEETQAAMLAAQNRPVGQFPFPGSKYDDTIKQFVPPKPPFASWTYDATLGAWVAPKSYPLDGPSYTWDEQNQTWVRVKK